MSELPENTHERASESLLSDRFGRTVTYVRLSVTDRCNFRCVYCAPEEGFEHNAPDEVLSHDEIVELAGIFADHGVRKLRLTGGEPLVRAGIPELVGRLSDIEGLEHVAMTTNAFLLGRHAEALYENGLTSMNISLDSLRPDRFDDMTRVGDLERVLDGIRTALEVGFEDVKLNTVVLRDFNADELVELTEFAAELAVPIRFIEFMPIGDTIWEDADANQCVPAAEIREHLSERWELEPDDDEYGAGPAEYWRVHGPDMPEDGHPVGVIGAVTECFCSDCNRIRITSQGGLRACLADDAELSLRAPLRTIADPEKRRREIEERIDRALHGKHERHDFSLDGDSVTDTQMTAIGG
ncbi:MAG: GTP 3',8-cyclase MoaA [Bradymonadaceae bacterium]